MNERKTNGYFHGLVDFIRRIDNKFLNQETLEALIYAGAFDSFDSNRNHLLAEMPGILEGIKLSGGNVDLLKQLMPKKTAPTAGLSANELLEKEAEYLGTYVSGHPIDQYRKLIEIYRTVPVNQIQVTNFVRTVLYVKHVKLIRTKNQTQMAFVDVSDPTGEIEMTVFPQQFAQFGGLLHSGEVLMITGKVQERNGKLNLVANTIQRAAEISDRCYYLRVDQLNALLRQQLLQVMRQNHGSVPVIVYEKQRQRKIAMEQQYWLSDSAQTRAKLVQLLGKGNVVLQ